MSFVACRLRADPLAGDVAATKGRATTATKRQASTHHRKIETRPKRFRNDDSVSPPSPPPINGKVAELLGTDPSKDPIALSPPPHGPLPDKTRSTKKRTYSNDSKMSPSPEAEEDANFACIINRSPYVKLTKLNSGNNREAIVTPLSPPISPIHHHKYSLRSRCPPPADKKKEIVAPIKRPPPPRERKNPFAALESARVWSDCEVARQYDLRHNFFPEPGPSGWTRVVPFQPVVHMPSNYYQSLLSIVANAGGSGGGGGGDNNNDASSPPFGHNDSIHMQSFYGSLPMNDDSPAATPPLEQERLRAAAAAGNFLRISTPLMVNLEEQFSNWNVSKKSGTSAVEPIVVVEGLLSAPSYDEVLGSLWDYGITSAIDPFYGDANDVATVRDVGNAVLSVPSSSDLEPFKSSFHQKNVGLDAIRRRIFEKTVGKSAKYKSASIGMIDSFLSTERQMQITPVAEAPSMFECDFWLSKQARTVAPLSPAENGSPTTRSDEIKCDTEASDSDEVIDSSQANEKSIAQHLDAADNDSEALSSQLFKSSNGSSSGGDAKKSKAMNTDEAVST